MPSDLRRASAPVVLPEQAPPSAHAPSTESRPVWWRPSDPALALDDLASGSNSHNSAEDDDDDASDDPAWCQAPEWSLQPAIPVEVLKKMDSSPNHSSRSNNSDAPLTLQALEPSTSPPPYKTKKGTDDADDSDEDIDYFPPQPLLGRCASANAISPLGRKPKPLAMNEPEQEQEEDEPKKPLKSALKKSKSGKTKSKTGKPKKTKKKKTPVANPSGITSPKGSGPRPSKDTRPRASTDFVRDGSLMYRPSDIDGLNGDMRTGLRRDSLAQCAGDPLANSRMSVLDADLPDFLLAARTGNISTLQSYLTANDASREVMQRDAVHGQTALHLAVRNGQFLAVRALCNSKYKACLVKAVDTRENSALHLAAARSRRVTEFLVEHAGADVNAVNGRGQTPLGVHILTARRDDPFITELLLSHNAEPNARLNQSNLLHKAIDQRLYEIAGTLVRYGAQLDTKDENGKMVFDKVNRKVLRALISKIAFPPAWVPDGDRTHCMLCSSKFRAFGNRRHHCRHCGRVCCAQCSHAWAEVTEFPESFQTALTGKRGRSTDKNRICMTCSSVFRERELAEKPSGSRASNFVQRVLGCEWDELRPNENDNMRGSTADFMRGSTSDFRASTGDFMSGSTSNPFRGSTSGPMRATVGGGMRASQNGPLRASALGPMRSSTNNAHMRASAAM